MADLNSSDSFLENFSIVLDVTIQQKYNRSISSNPGLVTFYGVLLVMLETLGNFSLICVIFYEKYGMDAQKRTITNQLLTKTIFVQIFCNIFIMPLYAIFGFQCK